MEEISEEKYKEIEKRATGGAIIGTSFVIIMTIIHFIEFKELIPIKELLGLALFGMALSVIFSTDFNMSENGQKNGNDIKPGGD